MAGQPDLGNLGIRCELVRKGPLFVTIAADRRGRWSTTGSHFRGCTRIQGLAGVVAIFSMSPETPTFALHKLSQRNRAALEHVDRGKPGAIITNRGESLWLGTSWLGGIFGARRHLLRCSRAYYRARSLLKSVHVQPPFSDGADGTSGRRSFQRLWNLSKRLR
jgi:hypothetical protein